MVNGWTVPCGILVALGLVAGLALMKEGVSLIVYPPKLQYAGNATVVVDSRVEQGSETPQGACSSPFCFRGVSSRDPTTLHPLRCHTVHSTAPHVNGESLMVWYPRPPHGGIADRCYTDVPDEINGVALSLSGLAVTGISLFSLRSWLR
jgi:hypothetical protein